MLEATTHSGVVRAPIMRSKPAAGPFNLTPVGEEQKNKVHTNTAGSEERIVSGDEIFLKE